MTINSARYIHKLNNFLRSEFRRRKQTIKPLDLRFQQNRTPPPTSITTMNVIREMFFGCLISRFGDVHWPLGYLTWWCTTFFLWEYLWSRIYKQKPYSLVELENSIRTEITLIDKALLQRVHSNFFDRLAFKARK